MNKFSSLLLVLMLASISSGSLHAEPFEDWLRARITSLAGKKKTSQTESISVDHGSTNFVDQTSGADLFSSALNFLPVQGNDSGKGGSGTVSVSLYGLYSLATGQDSLAPSVYNKHERMRSLFLSAGREEQNESNANRGVIAGVKWLVSNQRDASSIERDTKTRQVLADILAKIAQSAAAARTKLQTILMMVKPESVDDIEFLNSLNSIDEIDKAIAKLKPGDRAQVNQIVSDYVKQFEAAGGDLENLVSQIQKRPQVAVDFQTKQRSGSSSDDYRLQLVYDRALSGALSLALNGSYDYANSSNTGGDVRGGRGAFEVKYNITQVAGSTLRSPMQVALSGEGLHQASVWKYRAQLRVVIPIFAGINLPLSFGYGNQSELVHQQEKSVYGKFGLTFDFAKIVETLKDPN